jgi:hypothetical protein
MDEEDRRRRDLEAEHARAEQDAAAALATRDAEDEARYAAALAAKLAAMDAEDRQREPGGSDFSTSDEAALLEEQRRGR